MTLKLKIEHLPAFLSIQKQQIIVFMFTSTAFLNRRISSGISYVAPSPKAIEYRQTTRERDGKEVLVNTSPLA